MDTDQSGDTPTERDQASGPDDGFLIASVLGGDSSALRKLMDRYDRLVRYTIFRIAGGYCGRDPDWLESVASDTWIGFVRAIRRESEDQPRSMKAYLVRIARNRAISALRQATNASGRDSRYPEVLSLDDDPQSGGPHTRPDPTGPLARAGATSDSPFEIPSTLEDPAEISARLELIEAVRDCLSELDVDGRAMASQLSAITERRWRDAAHALGIKESTLRSRWKQVLGRLAVCVRGKTGRDFALPGHRGD